MKILFIGGNGNISWYCVQKAIDEGHQVYELNRGITRKTRRQLQPEVRELICDIRNKDEVEKVLGDITFDVVCDFICYNEIHAQVAIELFKNRTKRYIFISSEAVYKRLPNAQPFNENSLKYNENEIGGYIGGKISAEKTFIKAYETIGFPVTIVRPGYTYDTIMPSSLGHNCFTLAKKIREGFPMLVFGDGKNLLAPLHSRDFAEAFYYIVTNRNTIGDDYQITSTNTLTMNEMAKFVVSALGGVNKQIINIPYNDVLAMSEDTELIKQQLLDYVFDNTKLSKIAPEWKQKILFEDGILKTVAWYDEDDCHKRIDLNFENELDKLYDVYWREK